MSVQTSFSFFIISVTVTYSASIYVRWIDDWFANVCYPSTTDRSML